MSLCEHMCVYEYVCMYEHVSNCEHVCMSVSIVCTYESECECCVYVHVYECVSD